MRHPRKLACAVLLLGIGFAAAPASAASATGGERLHDDITITSLDISWYLTLDERGLSGLVTTEHLTASFGYEGEDRRLERTIPLTVDGVAVQPVVDSVADDDGAAIPFTTRVEPDHLVVSIDVDASVHSTHKYVLTYSQYNVAKPDADPAGDTFRWNADVEGWGRRVWSVTAHIYMDSPLSEGFRTTAASCGRGSSTGPCEISATPERDFLAAYFPLADARVRGPLAITLGFPDGTFVAPLPLGHRLQLSERMLPPSASSPTSSPDWLAPVVPKALTITLSVVALLALVVAVVAYVVWATKWRDTRG